MKRYYDIRNLLDDYNYLDVFYEELIKYKGLKKLEVFKELDIPYTSYVRALETNKQSNLLKYFASLRKKFNINEYRDDSLDQFNRLFNNVLYRMFYVGDGEDDFSLKLEEYMSYKNELYPICKLLIMYNRIMSKNYNYWTDKIIDIKELEIYKRLYILSPFQEIYHVLVLLTSEKLVELDIKDSYDKELNDLLYVGYSYNAYANKRYDRALYYANKAKDYLNKSYNIKMMFTINVLYLKSLLEVGGYKEIISIAKPQLIAIYEYKVHNNLLIKTKECLYLAYYALERHDEFRDFFYSHIKYDYIDLIFILLFKMNDERKYSLIIDKYKSNISTFKEEEAELVEKAIRIIESVKAKKLNKAKALVEFKELLRVKAK